MICPELCYTWQWTPRPALNAELWASSSSQQRIYWPKSWKDEPIRLKVGLHRALNSMGLHFLGYSDRLNIFIYVFANFVKILDVKEITVVKLEIHLLCTISGKFARTGLNLPVFPQAGRTPGQLSAVIYTVFSKIASMSVICTSGTWWFTGRQNLRSYCTWHKPATLQFSLGCAMLM